MNYAGSNPSSSVSAIESRQISCSSFRPLHLLRRCRRACHPAQHQVHLQGHERQAPGLQVAELPLLHAGFVAKEFGGELSHCKRAEGERWQDALDMCLELAVPLRRKHGAGQAGVEWMLSASLRAAVGSLNSYVISGLMSNAMRRKTMPAFIKSQASLSRLSQLSAVERGT